MNGLLLIAGVLSACVSLIALAGGLVMLYLSCLVAWGTAKNFKDEDKASAFCIVGGCLYLGLSALFGCWVPAVSWIVVGCAVLVGSFLTVVTVYLNEDINETL